MTSAAQARWLEKFPALAEMTADERARLAGSVAPLTLRAGDTAFTTGMPCAAFLLVVAGQVRVHEIGINGREIVLYRVGPGETCILTTACLLGGERYPAEGLAEGEVHALALPRAEFDRLLAHSAAFRAFVLGGFGRRIVQLMAVIDGVAFGRIDQRLAALLLERADGGRIALTHEALAAELGSAREVVSRRLKSFERAGWLRVARGRIEIVAPQPLGELAREAR